MYAIVYTKKAAGDIPYLKEEQKTVKIISMWTHYEF